MAPTLILALDQPDRERALALFEKVAGTIRFFKIGSELFTAAGPAFVREIAEDASVFLDLKFHDIPETVARAVSAAAKLGVRLLDVHCSGGDRMLRAAREAAGNVEVYGVTVLTHFEEGELASVGWAATGSEQAVRLARLARASGLSGVVASGHEIRAVREATADALGVLVPGIRPAWANDGHDQRRIVTPREAAEAGARYVVVGRAIAGAPNPSDAAARVLEELHSG